MFTKRIKLVAGVLLSAVVVMTVKLDVFKATEESTYTWNLSVGFTAGAHHAIGETVVLNDDTKKDELASGVISEENPIVSEATRVEGERLDVEEEAARVEAERLAAEEAARIEAERLATEEAERLAKGQAVVDYALQFVGNPYVLGGSSLTDGIDCSNFVMRVYEPFGVTLPHTSYELRSVGYEVSADEIQPGDIICYSGHVSIYIGDGKCVHASNPEDGIKVSPKWTFYKVITIRRIF